jgi:hypothetical protein
MAKPTVVPTFASSVNYPMDAEPEQGTATKVAPSGAVESYGYRPEAKPKAQNLNYVLYWLSQWAAYVNAGEWDGNLHVTGTLIVDGLTTINDDVTATGALTVASAQSTGATALSLPQGATASANKHITISGTGRYLHGDKYITSPIEVNDLIDHSGGTVGGTLGTAGCVLDASVTEAWFRLPSDSVRWDSQIKGFAIFGTGGTGSAGLHRYDSVGGTYSTVAVVGGSGSGSAFVGMAGGAWTLVPATINEQPGYVYVVKIVPQAGVGATLTTIDTFYDTVAP